jgi:hypothetical protein
LLFQHLPDELADAAVAGDDHVAARARRVRHPSSAAGGAMRRSMRSPRLCPRRATTGAASIDTPTTISMKLADLAFEQAERERHADHDEGELAALAEQQAALGRAPPRQAEDAQQHEHDERLHGQQTDDREGDPQAARRAARAGRCPCPPT